MSKSVNISIDSIKESIQEYIDQVVTYFKGLPQDEDYAWIAIAAGFVLFILGLILA